MRKLRAKTPLTMKGAADQAGVSPTYWRDLELEKRKEPTLTVAIRIAEVLGVSLMEFARGIDDPRISAE